MTLREEWPALEADFQHYYHADLRAVADEWGCRRLLALIEHLPPEAALWRSMRAQKDPRPSERKRKTNDPNVIAAFFQEKVKL